jgi:hypothetical protein
VTILFAQIQVKAAKRADHQHQQQLTQLNKGPAKSIQNFKYAYMEYMIRKLKNWQ